MADGNIMKANELLGTAYTIRGLVVHGNHLGRTLGFPTANLQLPDDQPILARYGVFAVTAGIGTTRYRGMINVGTRPTIDGKTLTIEVNLFDFDGDLYGKMLEVSFISRIRDEKKFSGLDELVQQLRQDREMALRLLS